MYRGASMRSDIAEASLSKWISGAAVGILGGDAEDLDELRRLRPCSMVKIEAPRLQSDPAAARDEIRVPEGIHDPVSVDVVVAFVPLRAPGPALAEARRLTGSGGRLLLIARLGTGGPVAAGIGEALKEACLGFEFMPPERIGKRLLILGQPSEGPSSSSSSWCEVAINFEESLEQSQAKIRSLQRDLEAARSRLADAEEDAQNIKALEERSRRSLEETLDSERAERIADVEALVDARRDLHEAETKLRRAEIDSAAEITKLRQGIQRGSGDLEAARMALREAWIERDEKRDAAAVLAVELEETQAAARAAERQRPRISEVAPSVWREWLTGELLATHKRLTYEIERNHELMAGRAMRAQRAIWKARRSREIQGLAVATTLMFLGMALVTGIVLSPGVGIGVLGASVLLVAVVVLALTLKSDGPRLQLPRVPARSRSVPLPVARAEDAPTPPKVASPRLSNPRVRVEDERSRWMAKNDLGPRPVSTLRVAGIADEITSSCLAPDCEWRPVPSEWEELMTDWQPDLLFVESAWAGNDGQWQYQIGSYEHPLYRGLPQLRLLLDWCEQHDIPTVFWNKEDPVHFDRFREAAPLFQHVFTSDVNRVQAYTDLAGRTKTVDPLPFAAQPQIHNPVRRPGGRSSSPCFAGTYYNDRHPSRRKSLEDLLDAAIPHGLVIYDRMHGSSGDNYAFPERFRPHIVGRLPYDRLIDVYKGHDVFLNVNSVIDSPTMFSRRVFELLACDTAVLSTDSVGVRAIFGDTVPIAESLPQASTALDRLAEDPAWRSDLVRRGRRLVLREHTYRRRLETVAHRCGIDVEADCDLKAACLVHVEQSDRPDAIFRLFDEIRAQGNVIREVIIGGPASDTAPTEALAGSEMRVRVIDQADDRPTAERYREMAQIATTPWAVPTTPGRRIGAHQVEDLAACAGFATADLIGRPLAMGATPPVEHSWVQAVDPRLVLARRDLVSRCGWPDEADAAQWMVGRFSEGARLYAGDALDDADTGALSIPNTRDGTGSTPSPDSGRRGS